MLKVIRSKPLEQQCEGGQYGKTNLRNLKKQDYYIISKLILYQREIMPKIEEHINALGQFWGPLTFQSKKTTKCL